MMNKEGSESVVLSPEEMVEVFSREINQALSPTWAKSTQELLPGYLPNKLRSEYTPQELALYQCAYKLVGEMVARGTVEVLFDEEQIESSHNSIIENEMRATPRFKLVTNGGKKSKDEEVSWRGTPIPEGGW